MMVRTVWIGLVGLIAICGLTAYKIGFAAPAKIQVASADPTSAIASAPEAPPAQVFRPTQIVRATPVAKTTQDAPATQDASATQVAPAIQDAPAIQAVPAPQNASATQGTPATKDAPANQDAPANEEAPATKTDRLDVDHLQDVPSKTLVHTIPIVISDPATKVEPEKSAPSENITRNVGRHWRSSYARLNRRHIHIRHHPEASKPANDAKVASTGGLLGWLRSKQTP